MPLSFGEDRWKDIIREKDFDNELYPSPDTAADTILGKSRRTVTYNLRDNPLTDEAYEGLVAKMNTDSTKDVSFKAGELLAEIVLEATEERFEYWETEQFYEPNPGRDSGYERYGTPFLRILDKKENENELVFGTQPFNTVAFLKERYGSDNYSPPEGFLEGMDKVIFRNAYGEMKK